MEQWVEILGALILIAVISALYSNKSRRAKLPPGPTGWPLMGSLPLLGNRPHEALHKLSMKYGPIMYMKLGTTDTVVVSSPRMIEAFLKTNDLIFSSRPPNAGAIYMASNMQDLVWRPYGPRWRLLRKVCSVHLFAGKALDDMSPHRYLELLMLSDSILKSAGGGAAVNLGELLNVCTANILGQVMIGKRVFASEGSATANEFREMVVELMVLAGEFIIGDFVPWLSWFDPQGVQSKLKKLSGRFDSFFQRMIDEHLQSMRTQSDNNGTPTSFLSILLSLKDNADGEGSTLSLIDIKALLVDLFTAGTDTSSSTTEWAVAELIRNPHMMRKCLSELDTVVGKERTVRDEDIQNLPYLQAVVKETFRLHPSTPLLLPRLCAEDVEIEGYLVPKDARVTFNAWGMQRDPSVWERPLEFDPERFIGTDVDVKGTNYNLIPFGAGRRICAGMNMGIRTVQMMLATLIHSFEWSLGEGIRPRDMNMEEAFGLTLQKKVPLMAVPTPRLPIHLYSHKCT